MGKGGEIKIFQFAAMWHLLQQGRPMIDFVAFKFLFQLLNIENYPHKYWFNSTKWSMAKVM
jgi:hypothetical protein